MGFVKLLAVVAAVLGPVSVAQAASYAAQYKLELFLGEPDDPFGDDVADAVGSIKVNQFDGNSPDVASDLAASIVLDGVTFDYPSGISFTFSLNKSTLTIGEALLSGPYPISPETVPALWFSTFLLQSTDFGWQLRDCSTNGNGGFSCIPSGRTLGGYTLTPVTAPIPLPATALLLPAALGALAAVRRRRRG